MDSIERDQRAKENLGERGDKLFIRKGEQKPNKGLTLEEVRKKKSDNDTEVDDVKPANSIDVHENYRNDQDNEEIKK